MQNVNKQSIVFPSIKKLKVKADFNGGDITSDGGALLLRSIDNKLNLSKNAAKLIPDLRIKNKCKHSSEDLLRQRLYGLSLGYEDLNDHDFLRHDSAIQAAVQKLNPLASSATLCRFENKMKKSVITSLHGLMIDTFIDSFSSPPKELILDFDATDDIVHGNQEGRFFHGYYDNYCFLPLYVFCGRQLLVSYLRPANIDPARHSWAILSLIVKRFRAVWPQVKIIIRADSGFCRWRMLRWCDSNNVGYIIGIAKNSKLNEIASTLTEEAEKLYSATNEKQRLFTDIYYAAKTWDEKRRIIVKAEHNEHGSNPRYITRLLHEFKLL